MSANRSSVAIAGGDAKKPRKSLSLELKLDILRRIEKGERQVDICNSLSLAGSTVRTILKNKEKIEEYGKLDSPQASVRFVKNRSPIMIEMERLLGIWIEDQTQRNLPVSSLLIQEKAKSLYEKLKSKSPQTSDAEPFKASAGWFERFKRRANLHITALQGEAGGSDEAGARSRSYTKHASNTEKGDIIINSRVPPLNLDDDVLTPASKPWSEANTKCERISKKYGRESSVLTTKIPSYRSISFVKQEPDSEEDDEEPIDLESKTQEFSSENDIPIQRSDQWDVYHSKLEQDFEKGDEESISSGPSEHSRSLEKEHSMSRPKHRLNFNEPDTETNGMSFFSEPRVPTKSLGNEKPIQRRKYVRKKDTPYFHKGTFSVAETRRLEDGGTTDIDEDKLFLLSLLPPLKRLPLDVKSSIKLKFQQIMHEVSYGDIQPSSFYNHSPPCSPYAVSMYSQSPIPEVVIHNSNPSRLESNRPSPPIPGTSTN